MKILYFFFIEYIFTWLETFFKITNFVFSFDFSYLMLEYYDNGYPMCLKQQLSIEKKTARKQNLKQFAKLTYEKGEQ